MNDSVLLMTGMVVFGLMLVGIVSTILEFRQVRNKDLKRKLSDQNESKTG